MYKIQLNNFEGPIDLLLYFIRRDELDIYDIPIAKITKEFIDAVEEWERVQLHIAGDFIVMASTLMRIKAKLLLPRPELGDDVEIIDFEYACYNYISFEIANFFCEFCGIPNFNTNLFPSKETRFKFYKEYLKKFEINEDKFDIEVIKMILGAK